MAVVNRKHGYLFLAEPHCAARSVEDVLSKQEGSIRIDAWIHSSYARLVHRFHAIGENESLYKFSVVRHPCDWIVTKYMHMTSWHRRGFRAYVEHYLNEGSWDSTVFMHAQDTDRVLKCELLDQQLNDVLEWRGAPPVTLPRLGQSKDKKPWASYFDADLLERLKNQLNDFRTYGYTL